MTPLFTLETPRKVLAGPGSLSQLGAMISDIDSRDALVVTDSGVASAGLVGPAVDILESNGWKVTTIDSIDREPDVASVDRVIEQCRSYNCGLVIGIGGGSVLDTAKILGCLIETDHSLEAVISDSISLSRLTDTCLIPTTAGTGSEATKNAIFSIREKRAKEAVISSELLPDYVILDPQLTTSLPPEMTAATGMDALCHAVECFISLKATPLSDLLALDAIGRINRSLLTACDSGKNLEARTDLMLASFYAGMCITLSGTTAVHALSYPLGAAYHVPHGVANAILLGPVVDFDRPAISEKLSRALSAFGLSPEEEPGAASRMVVTRIRELKAETGLPSNLIEFGIRHEDIDELVDSAFGIKRLMDNNPKPMTKADIRSIYEQIQ